MTPERWERLKQLFASALEMPAEKRAQFVSQARADDPELGKELEALLAANDEETRCTLDAPLVNLHDLYPGTKQAFHEGDLLLGRFRIVRHLGSGGMGEVYEAEDGQLGRIAVKTIRPAKAASSEALSRFKKEVQLARKVSSPNVCRIHELFLEDGPAGAHGAFVTMEFLEGTTLTDRVRDSGPMPWGEAKKVALEICAALQSIHEAGIIHRDLKGRNIMLTSRDGITCAVLMDFGIARRLSRHSGESSTALTMQGAVLGTPGYMAPEQSEGKEATPATDVYALGIVFYEMATGKRPFPAEDPPSEDAIVKVKSLARPSSIQPGVPRRFDRVVCRCLEYDPKRRYQSAKEVEQAIRTSSIVLRIQQRPLTVAAGAIVFVLVLFCLLLIPAVGERVRGILFSSGEKHIAVLPFEIAGNDPQTQALGDGLMDSLAGKLSNLDTANQSLWVVPASEVRRRKVTDPSSALREFGATIVVQGSFERSGSATRLRLTLVDPKKTREIGFADVDNQAGDLAALEDEAVTRLGRLMNVSVKDDSIRAGGTPTGRVAYEDYLVGLGYIQRYDKAGNLDAAIASLQRAVSTDPNFALGHAQLGEAYRLKYQIDRDSKWLDPAQTYSGMAIKLDNRVASAYVTLARIHEITGKHELALQEFQRAVNHDPRDANALNGLAHSYENSGHAAEAEATFQKAAAMRPDYWDGYDELGNFYDRQARFAEAIEQYKKALLLTPDNAQVYANLGATYLDSGNQKLFPLAEDALNRSLALTSNDYYVYANLGFLYGFEKRYPDAVGMTEKALQLNEHDWRVWAHLIVLYDRLNEIKKVEAARAKTLELVQQVVKLETGNAEAQSMLAALYARGGVRDKAIERIRSSLALAPNDAQVLTNLAQTYSLLGNEHLAAIYAQRALQKGQNRLVIEEDPRLQMFLDSAPSSSLH